MILNPPGHPPCVPSDVCNDQDTAEMIQKIAQETSINECLLGVHGYAPIVRFLREAMRADLFRSEQLAQMEPSQLVAKAFIDLPQNPPRPAGNPRSDAHMCGRMARSGDLPGDPDTGPGATMPGG
jgi:hypothetical protein